MNGVEDKLKELEKRIIADGKQETDSLKEADSHDEKLISQGFIQGIKVALFEIQNIDKPYFK